MFYSLEFLESGAFDTGYGTVWMWMFGMILICSSYFEETEVTAQHTEHNNAGNPTYSSFGGRGGDPFFKIKSHFDPKNGYYSVITERYLCSSLICWYEAASIVQEVFKAEVYGTIKQKAGERTVAMKRSR